MALKKNGRYPGPGYDEQGPGVPVPPKKKASTKYSPAPMSAAAKAKAAAAGKATAARTKPKSTAEKVAGAAGRAAKAVKDKVSPPKRNVGPGKKLFPNQKPGSTSGSKNGFTPKELAALKKMLSGGGRLDK